MRLTRLKLAGFKTFVEPTEFLIEPGLTGVVGPNGCGKSNLVEALRWVMGESSFKNMRGSGMDDVIFGGSGERAARNMAEVALTLDNSERRAPAAFNDSDVLEVTRRIEREEGSTYRVNGKEVRARDVQLLFADAATGARSPALVRQGQISELIAAKPQSRRRILEDAAGIAGLHSRRHEAELRLKAAEDNLVRLEDVLGEIAAQMEGLQRQARQAARYRSLAGDIRRAEAQLALIGHDEAQTQARLAADELAAATRVVNERALTQAEAAKVQAVAANGIPALRETEAAAAAALVRLKRALDEVEAENRRARRRAEELVKRLAELRADLSRQEAIGRDAADSLARLTAEDEALLQAQATDTAAIADARTALAATEAALAGREAAHAEAQATLSDLVARRQALERGTVEARARHARIVAERDKLKRDAAALDASEGETMLSPLRDALGLAETKLKEAEAAATGARRQVQEVREREAQSRSPLGDAERTLQRLETEIRTLNALLAPADAGRWPPVIESIQVEAGYEVALAAALGDDLDAATAPDAPAYWQQSGGGEGDPALPAGCEPLLARVNAPPELSRRLAQIGIARRETGPQLAKTLRPGQRLVSLEGDLWRWDGFVTAADAPSPAARRLAERNRLSDLETQAGLARQRVETAREIAEQALRQTAAAVDAETAALAALKLARTERDGARDALLKAERKTAETAARRAAVDEGMARLDRSVTDFAEQLAAQEAALADLPAAAEPERALLAARAELGDMRLKAAEARAGLQSLAHEADLRRRRRDAIATEIAAWRQRADASIQTAQETQRRIETAAAEQTSLLEAPDTYLVARRRLLAEIETAEEARKAAADRLAEGETALAAADRAARDALDGLAAAREMRASAEARAEAARQRLDVRRADIADTFEGGILGLAAAAGAKPGEAPPPKDETERRLQFLRGERERLGAVNLRADSELEEIRSKRDGLDAERADLTEAVRRLRQAIAALNREGRERLLAAFEIVDGHFQRLFAVLFGGGTAQLSLVDADDPLDAGLEILARPPGKKPQVMTLLSGGEQALTATALIFAVFLTNPSPICVLDEVDAPLDDANVERYCDLLDEMARETATRFILITHNPITMARMDRLFGVTMAERGVSQLVSVDLATAERIREAG